jgi:hypothetical protein
LIGGIERDGGRSGCLLSLDVRLRVEYSCMHIEIKYLASSAQPDWAMGQWTHGEINRLCLNRLDLCHDFETWSVNSVDPSFDFTMKAVIQRVINASVAGQ